MRISDILREKRPCFSFEFFPPRSDEGVAALLETVATLRALDPGFVSVTYGAGGSTRARTLEVVTSIKSGLDLEAMAHVTCVGASRDDLREVLARVAAAGIDNVLALRGDPPQGYAEFRMPPGGLAHAADLVRLARHEFSFCIGGACHPETHVEAPDAETDLRHLRAKVEAGAEFLITQLFFDNDIYFRFVERARRAGIGVPIIPGIMPITNAEQVARFTRMCGASLPARLLAELEARRDQPEAVQDLGVAYATLQCADLLARGVSAIHFYTLNRSPAARAVVSALLAARPWEKAGGVEAAKRAAG